MTRIMEGQESDTESNLYEMIQCVKTILKSDSESGNWDDQVKPITCDADVPIQHDTDPNGTEKCEPGGWSGIMQNFCKF
jgi:hypothetical protein